jgi:hypothetical protein
LFNAFRACSLGSSGRWLESCARLQLTPPALVFLLVKGHVGVFELRVLAR